MTPVQLFQLNNGLKPDNDLGTKTAKAFKAFYGIATNEACAHFLGQMAHESGNFTKGRENTNYSAQQMANTWPYRYAVDPKAKPKVPNALAYQLHRKPVAVANNCYANRMGNGDEASGDGWKNRGAGPLQITGADNIKAFADSVQNPCIIKNPDLIVSDYYFESALFFFNQNNLWRYTKTVNDASILTLSRAINIGDANSKQIPHGMKDRREKTYSYLEKLNRK